MNKIEVDAPRWVVEEHIVGMYADENYSTGAIAKQFGVSRQAIHAILKKHGVSGRDLKRKIPEGLRQEILDRLSSKSQQAVADELEIPVRWVAQTATEEGFFRNESLKHTRAQDKYQAMREYLKNNPTKSVHEIAKHFNVSIATAYRAVGEEKKRLGYRAQVIDLVKKLHASGESYDKIGERLIGEGFRPQRAEKWNRNMIAKLVQADEKEVS